MQPESEITQRRTPYAETLSMEISAASESGV
jgi:hypothetical protein